MVCLPGTLLVSQHVSRAFAQPISRPDIGQRGSRVGVACEILQVDDIRSPLAGGGERRDAERVDGHVGVELEGLGCFGPGRPGLLLTRGSHRSGRARQMHPVRHAVESLSLTRLGRGLTTRTFRGSITQRLISLSTLRSDGHPSPRKTRFRLLARLCRTGLVTRRVSLKGFTL